MGNTKDMAQKVLDSLYGGNVTLPKAPAGEHHGRYGHYRTGGMVTEKPGNVSHFAQLQREGAARAKREEEEAKRGMEAAHKRRLAREQLAALRLEKQQAWVDAGGTEEEFRAAWPKIREEYLLTQIAD